jgi:hypothetical protein
MHPDGLAAAKKCAIPGHCLFCEEPLSPPKTKTGRRRLICDGPDCDRSYNAAWKRDRTAGAARINDKKLPGQSITWHCECGAVVHEASFYRHRRICLFAREAFPVVIIPRAA